MKDFGDLRIVEICEGMQFGQESFELIKQGKAFFLEDDDGNSFVFEVVDRIITREEIDQFAELEKIKKIIIVEGYFSESYHPEKISLIKL